MTKKKEAKKSKTRSDTSGGVLKPVNPTSLKNVKATIENLHGKGAVMRLTDVSVGRFPYQVETGSIGLDVILGPVTRQKNGRWQHGLTPGRIIEIYGPESTGKTTLALHVVAAVQQLGGTAAYCDMEHAVDPLYAKTLGVDIGKLELTQPDYGEQCLEQAELFVRSGFGVVVVDSVAALVPKAELEGEMGDNHVGLQARLMSQALRKLSSLKGPSLYCTIIFINQIREKIGVMYGSPETTPGGRALKFYSDVRLDIRRTDAIKPPSAIEGTPPIGHRLKIKTVKNKIAPPFRQVECSLYYGFGLHKVEELVDLATGAGVLTKTGAWYALGEERVGIDEEGKLGAGRVNAVRHLQQDGQLRWKVYDAYLTAFNAARGLTPEGNPLPGFKAVQMPTLATTFDPKAQSLPDKPDAEEEEGEFVEDDEAETAAQNDADEGATVAGGEL